MNRSSFNNFAGGLAQAAGHVSNYITQRKDQLRKEQISKAFADQFGDKFSAAGLDPQMFMAMSGHNPLQALTAAKALRGQTHIIGDRVEGRRSVSEDMFGNLGAPKEITPGTGDIPNSEIDLLRAINDPKTPPEKKAIYQSTYDARRNELDRRSSLQGTARGEELLLQDSRNEVRLNNQVNELSAEIRKLESDIQFRSQNLGKTAPSARQEAQRQLNTLRTQVAEKRGELTKAQSELKQFDVKRKPKAPAQAGPDTSWNVSPGGVQYRIVG